MCKEVVVVSTKLILMTYSNSISANKLELKLDEINKKLDKVIKK